MYFKQMSKSFKPFLYQGGIGYLTCAVLYAGSSSYRDAVNRLQSYRSSSTKEKEVYRDVHGIHSEWEACKDGACYGFTNYYFQAFMWPLSFTIEMIPRAVMFFNKKID